MKIMVMSDEESKSLWDHYTPGKLSGYDLILSSGDLKSEYLSFVETFSNAMLLYVHGNHDENYAEKPPEGCFPVEDDIFVYQGVRILGLGGSMRYRKGNCQYTEAEMQKRIRKLRLKLWKYGGFDILLTHAPISGVHDGDDLCHQGFEAFRDLILRYSPKYFIHGHTHMNYGMKTPRLSLLNDTIIINAFTTYSFEYGDEKLLEEAAKNPVQIEQAVAR